ncbi:hypothetical protein MTP04_30190 [Lysinibacillus sp. PLM2]|nr:hypothetical protein MTP04_30190 [Lysinibacillus sp. PLM2]
MKDLVTKKEFIQLRSQGTSFNKIAEKLKVSKTTLIEWNKEFEKEIANLKAIELEELFQMYYVQKRKRIEIYGNQLEKIIGEIEKRNLSDLQTDKLFELKLKYLEHLKKEEIDLSIQIEEDLDDYLTNFNRTITKFSI